MQIKIQKQNKGFTLVEMMIAVALFVTVAIIALSAILATNVSYKKSQDMRAITDNLDFAMQDMVRNIRTGSVYKCGEDSCGGNPSAAISYIPNNTVINVSGEFVPDESNREGYVICLGEGLYKVPRGHSSYGCDAANLSDLTKLTDSRITLDERTSHFTVLGTDPTPNTQQPTVTMILVGTMQTKAVTTPFILQTTVTSRTLDN